jgi:hypothetical protein
VSPSEINRAIAEIVQPVSVARTIPISIYTSADVLKGTLTHTITPNYYGSIDACAEFEKTLNGWTEKDAYGAALWQAIGPDHGKTEVYDFDDTLVWQCATATAPQRCEAYLRTIGKWRTE